MPVFSWRGSKFEAPSIESAQSYIQKQQLVGLPTDGPDPPSDILQRAKPYLGTIANTEDSLGLPRHLLKRVLYQESGFKPDIVSGQTTSSAGAVGIAQFMPATAQARGIDPTDPTQSIQEAGKYLAELKDKTGSWDTALMAYNWGLGNLSSKGPDKAPAETKNYVAQISRDVPLETSK